MHQIHRPFDFNIVLIGFMGVGKSTVAEYLGRTYGMDVIEMDQEISDREGKSIPEIFSSFGEAYFRSLETNLLIELQSGHPAVISCGGGAALRARNVVEMKKNGRVVLLTASPEAVYGRVKDCDNRPVLDGHKSVSGISALMEERREKYENAADIVVDTEGKAVQEICEEIIHRILEEEEA